MDSLNCSYDWGELSKSQIEAVITFIQKEDRDRRLIKTGDQIISLVNVDVKIGTKAKRLEKVLPYVIHHDQNALFDAVRTVNDVMDFTEMKGCKGIMSVIDFEKAFNSIRLVRWPIREWKVTLFTSNRHLVVVDRHLLLLSNR